jgi:3-oxoacyl-(acyl-carrier-protein) synthase
MAVAIVDYNIITAYGLGVEKTWDGILSGKSAVKKIERFDTRHFQSHNAAIVDGLKYHEKNSLVWQMGEKVLEGKKFSTDTLLILATTTGEIDLLEKGLLQNKENTTASLPQKLLAKLQKKLKLKNGMVISCACVSSSTAIAYGAAAIGSKKYKSVLVIGCDAVSEFVYCGFSSLMALDADKAKPFDKNRKGLSIGEAAGFMHLMSGDEAKKKKRKALAELAGYGLSNDANHMTGPSRDGFGLSVAIEASLKKAKIKSSEISAICAHGTATPYNDSMEMKAFKRVFNDRVLPAYSIKGALGHTMGAAGLVEAVICIKAMQEKCVPATMGLSCADEEAKGWVSGNKLNLNYKYALSVNAGFGGVNSALVFK